MGKATKEMHRRVQKNVLSFCTLRCKKQVEDKVNSGHNNAINKKRTIGLERKIFMENLKVLLCCGAGMSSGFLANNARKIAKKQKLSVSVEARSHSEVAQHLNYIDVLLLGPHYATELENFKKTAAPYGVKVAIIPQDIYASLDGARLIDLAKSLAEEKQ